MAEQYLINDTTLTSIADAIRVVTGLYHGNTGLANVQAYWMEILLPSEMPRAISGIVGMDNMPAVIGRSSIDASCVTINGISDLKSYTFAVSRNSTASVSYNASNPYDSVETVVLNDVRTMSDWAFMGWNNLTTMFILSTTVPSIDTYALWTSYNTYPTTIYVLSSMYDQFISASVWSEYSRHMVPVRYASELGLLLDTSMSWGGTSTRSAMLEHGQYLIQDTTLTSIASAIRGQLGVSTQYLPREMSTAVLSVGAPTDSTLLSVLNKTVKSFSDGQSSVTEVGDYAFAYCTDLSSVRVPACKVIHSEAFRSDSALTYISCSNVEYIGNMAFYGCSSLKSMSCSKCSMIWAEALENCVQLSGVSFPECQFLSTWTFARCSALTDVTLPKAESLPGSNFYSCVNLSTASFPNLSSIGRGTFGHCSVLKSLYLMSTSVVTLAASNAFEYSPMVASGSSVVGWGSIYVPTSLYSSYYNASVWSSYFRSRLVSM